MWAASALEATRIGECEVVRCHDHRIFVEGRLYYNLRGYRSQGWNM